MAMETISLQLFILVIATAVIATQSSSLTSPAPAPSPASSSAISFLRASCAVTDVPDACYNLLLPYADTFHGNLARVARAASAFAGARQRDFADELARLKLRGTGAGRVADMTLGDCYDTVSGDNMFANETLGHIDNLVAHVGSKKDFDFQRIMAQDWLQSSGSGMMQCVDWFHDAGEAAVSSPVGKEVIVGCTTVSSYMDIAFMLVNAIKF